MNRIRAAILGSGNIGTDLLYKIRRSSVLELTWMCGVIPESEGLARARKLGCQTTHQGIEDLLEHSDDFQIVFDATTARAHLRHAELLNKAGKIAIDLTPAAVGPYVVPTVNLHEHLDKTNVNLTTCGGQATTPIVAAIHRAAQVEYAEIVSTIASKSAGPGTRQNIDEFTETTAEGLVQLGGADRGKAIIILNPAEPPILMRNTVYAIVEELNEEAITLFVEEMVGAVRQYVPGYQLRAKPIFDLHDHQVTVLLEVEGAGDYLPKYAGNLDIMTAAAVRVAEEFARNLLDKSPAQESHVPASGAAMKELRR